MLDHFEKHLYDMYSINGFYIVLFFEYLENICFTWFYF